ncbi:transposase [bacterium]|nr:transposase [bacterium]
MWPPSLSGRGVPPVNFTSGNVRISGQQEVQDEEESVQRGADHPDSAGGGGQRSFGGGGARKQGISEQTFYRWRRKLGEMSVREACRLRELERENSQLKRMVAEGPEIETIKGC